MTGLLSYCIPAPSDRVPMTLWRVPYIFLPFILLVILSALARRPGTRLLRLAIFPFALIFTLRITYGFVWHSMPMNAAKFILGGYGLASAVQAVEFGLSPNGMLKVGEVEPGTITAPGTDLVSRDPLRKAANGHSHASVPRTMTLKDHALAGLELMTAWRGIGWTYGTEARIYVPPDHRDTTDTAKFLRQTYQSLIIDFLLADFFTSILHLVPNIGSPSGGEIFAFGSNAVEKYTISTGIHLLASLGLIPAIRMAYNLTTIIAVGIIGQHPSAWPPVLDHTILGTTSVHAFWARTWHQLLRHTFFFMGGYPFQAIFGDQGLIFGAFLASGFIHVWALYAIGRGTDYDSMIFFAVQPFVLLAEKAWRRMTGRRVSGVYGWLWTAFWLFGFGQFVMNSWQRRGFSGGILVPPALSPTKNLLIPKLRPILEKHLVW